MNRRKYKSNKCPICRYVHDDIFFHYVSKYSAKRHAAYEMDKSRPKQHPRKDKRRPGKPR